MILTAIGSPHVRPQGEASGWSDVIVASDAAHVNPVLEASYASWESEAYEASMGLLGPWASFQAWACKASEVTG